jgi:hypothetical protein
MMGRAAQIDVEGTIMFAGEVNHKYLARRGPLLAGIFPPVGEGNMKRGVRHAGFGAQIDKLPQACFIFRTNEHTGDAEQ